MTEKISIPLKITPELAEETGWHIGDGSMNYYRNQGKIKGIYQLRGHINDDRNHYIQRIKPIFKLLYRIDLSLREMPSTRVYGFQIWSNKLVDFKEKLGLPLGKKWDISIPPIFLENNELKISILRGIFDTDGGIYLQPKYGKLYPRIQITTISSNLAEQIQAILLHLGIRATKYLDWIDKNSNRVQAYVIAVRGNEMFDKFMEIIKPANPKHIKKYLDFKESFK